MVSTKAPAKPGALVPTSVGLAAADRERIAHLAEAWGTNNSDAIRRAVEHAYERHVQGLLGTQLDAIQERALAQSAILADLAADLASVRQRVEAGIEVTRAVERDSRSVMLEGRTHSATAALLLRAMLHTNGRRSEIEAEVQRLLQEARDGRVS